MQPSAGPFKAVNGSWYLPETEDPFGVRIDIGIYSRTPGAAPWSEQDFGGTDQPDHGNGSAWTYDPATDKIYLVSVKQGTLNNHIYTFNCATGLYQAMSVSDGKTATLQNKNCVKLSNGDVLHIYQDTLGSGKIYYNRLSGGAWGGETVLVNTGFGNSVSQVKAVCDASDRVHVAFIKAGSPSNLYYIQMAGTSGSVGSMTLVYTLVTSSPDANFGNIAISNTNNTVSLLVSPLASTTFTDHIPHVAVGTPLSAPVWTVSSPDSGGTTIDSSTQPQTMPLCLNFDDSGNLVALWGIAKGVDGTTGGFTHVEIWSNTFVSGAWGSPALFYDGVANPPPGVVYSNGLFNPLFYISTLKISNDWVLVSGWEQTATPFHDFTFIIAPIVSGGIYAHTRGCRALAA